MCPDRNQKESFFEHDKTETFISAHYIFHYAAGSAAEKDILFIAKEQEKCFSKICRTLEIDYIEKINYYLTDSPLEIGRVIWDEDAPCNGCALCGRNKIYATYNDDIKCIGSHEDTHLISFLINFPESDFLVEGLAMYMDGSWCGVPNEDWAAYYKTKHVNLSVKDLFDNDISKGMASTALVGDALWETGKIHTPEYTTQGVTAKAWVKKEGKTFLYKVARKDLAASLILDVLGFYHVRYEKVTGEELEMVVSSRRKEQIEALGEIVVKCELLTSEDVFMVNFEDYQTYCENHGMDVYEETVRLDNRHYLEMHIADYILNNIDRHTANWGYFMDNESIKINIQDKEIYNPEKNLENLNENKNHHSKWRF